MQKLTKFLLNCRFDSPGTSANNCCYTLMDYSSNLVLGYAHINVKETAGSSPAMETLGCTKSLDKLQSELNELNCSMKNLILCTDRNLSIAKILREDDRYKSTVEHEFDIWHLSKSIKKRIHQAGQQKQCGILHMWNKSITNHFWYVCENCLGDKSVLVTKWQSLLFHVSNISHDNCDHNQLSSDEIEAKAWITEGSPAFLALKKIIYDKKLISAIEKCRHYIHTSQLESLHNVFLKYLPKRLNFWENSTNMRLQLAIIEHNTNVDRKLISKKWPAFRKSTKTIKTRNVYEPKSYEWRKVVIKEIMQ